MNIVDDHLLNQGALGWICIIETIDMGAQSTKQDQTARISMLNLFYTFYKVPPCLRSDKIEKQSTLLDV